MKNLKCHQGYMGLIIAFLIAVIAVAGLATSYVYSNKALSVANSVMSLQAYYIAYSGIERAKYDITVNNFTCSAINGTTNYTNATFPNAAGYFTVTGTATTANTTLNGALNASATTIPLTSSAGFAATGTVLIDSELINYTAVSSNNLTGAMRGAGGTSAASHSSGVNVSENQCLLASSGGVPNLTSPTTETTIQATLIGTSFSAGQNSNGAGTGAGSVGGAGTGVFKTAVAIAGDVALNSGATITNGSVTSSSSNFSGSTIMSGGNVSIAPGAQTQVSNGSGGLQTASSNSQINQDVSTNNSQVNSSNLWSNFFSQSKSTVQGSAYQNYDSSNINGVTGKTIWANTLSLNSNTTIGSPTSPVILIVNGSLATSANFTFYGLLYVTGSVAMQGTTSVTGLFAMEGAFSTFGSTQITYNPGILTGAGNTNPSTNIVYSIVPSNVQEVSY